MNMTVRTTSNLRYGRLGLSAALLLATAGCSRSNVQAAAPAMPAPLVTRSLPDRYRQNVSLFPQMVTLQGGAVLSPSLLPPWRERIAS